MKPRIAILGAGPSAAFAYRACLKFGCADIKVIAQKRVTPIGAFWLWSMPKSVGRKITASIKIDVKVVGRGTADEYSLKMWDEVVPTSFPAKEFTQKGYHPRKGLRYLWDKAPLDKSWGKLRQKEILSIARDYDLVIQTFPTDESLTYQPEPISFVIATKYLTDSELPVGLCIYNGTRSQDWTRATLLGTHVSYEYPPNPRLNHGDLLDYVGAKHQNWHIDVATDLHPNTQPDEVTGIPNVILVGRNAQWRRKMMAHDAYERVIAELILRFGEKDAKAISESTN